MREHMDEPRFKAGRLALHALRSFLNGWSFNMVHPDDKLRDLSGWNLVSDFPTNIRQRPELGAQNAGRLANMELACQMLNGIRIKPHSVFSMFRIIGDPQPSRGFQLGPVIAAKGLDTTIGGGLCQISTALFNVALLAGCDILEQHNHSKDIWGDGRFVPLGKDAAYVFSRWDLQFRNLFNSDLALLMQVNRMGMSLKCQLWSPASIQPKVFVRHTTLEEIPAIRVDGTKGWVVLTERLIGTQTCEQVTYRAINRYQPT